MNVISTSMAYSIEKKFIARGMVNDMRVVA